MAVLAGEGLGEPEGPLLVRREPVAPQRGQILHLTIPDAETTGWPIVESFHSHYLLAFGPNRVVAGATHASQSGAPSLEANSLFTRNAWNEADAT